MGSVVRKEPLTYVHFGELNICFHCLFSSTLRLIEALTRAGVKEPTYMNRARLMFEEMLTYANHLGLYGEEIGNTGQSLGNFPQVLLLLFNKQNLNDTD
jgi:GH15 family glucan-1,4-alpha-glucosidase